MVPRRFGARPIALALSLAYFVVPVDGWGLFHGRPLGLLPLTVLAMLSAHGAAVPILAGLTFGAVRADCALMYTRLIP